jgi:hypothetical protein
MIQIQKLATGAVVVVVEVVGGTAEITQANVVASKI